MDVVALVANPLRAAGGVDNLAQKRADLVFLGPGPFFDSGQKRKAPRGRVACGQIAQRAAGFGEIFGGNKKFREEHLRFGILGLELGDRFEAIKPRLLCLIGL